MKRIIKVLKNLYKINIYNLIFIIVMCLCIFFLSIEIECFLKKILDIHFRLNLKIDFLTIYSGFLALILPVAILIIERIEAKDNAILSETYLKYTFIFPAVVYFVVNLFIFTFYKDQYYFILTGLFSTFIIIRMYYMAFKLISNLIYEREKTNEVKEELIANDLKDQTEYFSNNNLISNYKKYGIMISRYDYVTTTDYKKINIYPQRNYLLISKYNYKTLDKVVKKLKEINKEYVISKELENSDGNSKKEKNPNILIMLLELGSTLDKNRSWITIYYYDEYREKAEEIVKILSDKTYITSEINNHLYIDMVYKKIQNDCVQSINSMSSTLLTESLNKYLDIYKNYINEISSNIGAYSYETSYNQVNSIVKIKAYDFLNNIQRNIYDYADMIMENGNAKMMMSLDSFLYDMILYSYRKRELLSIQYLYSTYEVLNDYSLKLKNDSSYKSIKLQIFEFINLLKYDYNNVDKNFIHDVLLVCNKTLGNIIFNLSVADHGKFYEYYHKAFKLTKEFIEDFDHLNYMENKDSINSQDKLYDIYKNYICNLFATSAYILHNFELLGEKSSKLLSYFVNFDSNNLSKVLVDTIYMGYNSKMYFWELMEANRKEEDDGVYNINTTNYLIHLYCLIITQINTKSINIESNYELSIYADSIINELKKLDKKEYIYIYEKIVDDVKNEESEYVRNTTISEFKVEQFKNKFNECYHKYDKIQLLFKETNNLKIALRRKRGKYYLGIRNIVDKIYFLDHTPNNRCIIWSNFEESFANSFINSEEKMFANILNKKGTYKNESLIDYLSNLTKPKLNKSIIFSNYNTIYDTIGYDKIRYNGDNTKEKCYANMFLVIKNTLIPIVIIDGLDDNYIFHVYTNELGRIEILDKQFKIEINDFFNNEELLSKVMTENIKGLSLTGDEKKKHLQESVDLLIEEYIYYDDTKLNSLKFDH